MSGDDSAALQPSAQRVAAELRRLGSSAEVIELPDSARTAAEAAAALGCEVAQIAKSLVFRAGRSGRPVLVIACGNNRVDTAMVARHLGESLDRADADWVREQTGFAIGGIPPLGHTTPPVVYIDRDLLTLDEVWAAAGTPHAVFRVKPGELATLTGGTVMEVAAA